MNIIAADGSPLDILELDWKKSGGLLPAVVQDVHTRQVLMLGYVTVESLQRTCESGKLCFFSRSRQELWTKGETSGNFLHVQSIHADCDRDTLLVSAVAQGPTCHLGRESCFGDVPFSAVNALDQVIEGRQRNAPEGSYTQTLFSQGINRMAQKVGEEGVEVALAAVTADDAEFIGEAADLVYHLLVLLRGRGLDWGDVEAKLEARGR